MINVGKVLLQKMAM